jgi:hypothetical protein
LETAVVETSAWRATSTMVIRRDGAAGLSIRVPPRKPQLGNVAPEV